MPKDYTVIGSTEEAKSAQIELEKTPNLFEIPFQPSTLETIDFAMFEFINDTMNLYTTQNAGWKKVPVIWVSAERSFQIKRNKGLRDAEGALILPLITVERTSIIKDMTRKGPLQANIKDRINIARKINQEKSLEFANTEVNRRFASGAVKRGEPNFIRKKIKKLYTTHIQQHFQLIWSWDIRLS